MQSVLPEPINNNGKEDDECQCYSDDEMARHREIVWDQPDHVRNKDEHEQGKHQREELHPALADCVAYGVGDELVSELGDRLHSSGHELASGGGAEHQGSDNPDGDAHVEGGIREGKVDRADFAERKVVDDLELMDRIGHDRNGSLRFFITPPAQYAVGCYDLFSGGTPPSVP